MRRVDALAVAALLVPACSEFSPTHDTVVGSYTATTFTVQEDAGPVQDVLGEGGLINVTLTAGGATSGQLFVPGGGDGGADLDADLAGIWTLSDATVMLSHEADTFLRDMPLTATKNALSGSATFISATVSVVLTKE